MNEINKIKLDSHMLITGVSGSGKSTFLRQLIFWKLKTTDDIFLIIDPKRLDFNDFKNKKNIFSGKIYKTIEEITEILNWAICEMERRFLILEESNKKKWEGQKIIIVIDEVNDLFLSSNKIIAAILKLSQLGRAAGMLLILATQKPSSNFFPTEIKENLIIKIALKVDNHYSSKMAGVKGAEFLKIGEFLLKTPLTGEKIFIFENEKLNFENLANAFFKREKTPEENKKIAKIGLLNLNPFKIF